MISPLFQLKFISSDRFSFAKRSVIKSCPNSVKNIGREQLAEANWRRSVFCIPGGGGFIEMRTRVTVVASVVGSPPGRVDNTPTEY